MLPWPARRDFCRSGYVNSIASPVQSSPRSPVAYSLMENVTGACSLPRWPPRSSHPPGPRSARLLSSHPGSPSEKPRDVFPRYVPHHSVCSRFRLARACASPRPRVSPSSALAGRILFRVALCRMDVARRALPPPPGMARRQSPGPSPSPLLLLSGCFRARTERRLHLRVGWRELPRARIMLRVLLVPAGGCGRGLGRGSDFGNSAASPAGARRNLFLRRLEFVAAPLPHCGFYFPRRGI